MLSVLVDVLLPPVLVLVATVAVARTTDIDPKPLSSATFWLFSPCLVLDALVSGSVALDTLLGILLVPALVALATWGVGEAVLRMLRVAPAARDALLLGAVLTNAGNLGLPIVTFRWGETGATVGAVVLVATSMVSATIGVWIAARGSGGPAGLGRLFRVPLVWAAAIGMLLRVVDVGLPLPIGRAVSLLGQAAIPCMLVVLGLQLASIRGGLPADVPRSGLAAVIGLKLLMVPVLALAVGTAGGLEAPALHILVVQHATPTAVFSVVLATEYGRSASTAAWVVGATTVCALATLPVWLVNL